MKYGHYRQLLVIFFALICISNQLKSQLPNNGKALLPEGFSSLVVFGNDSKKSLVHEEKLDGEPFKNVLEINTFGKISGNGVNGITGSITSNIKKGDILWVSLHARCLESMRETGEGNLTLKFEQFENGKAIWPSPVSRVVSIGSKWKETCFPFVMGKDASPTDVKFSINFDSYEQRMQIGSIKFMNFGQDVKMSELPRSKIVYKGGEPTASWRKDAALRIEKLRKGDLVVKVKNSKGELVKDATVSIKMKRSAFNWGTAVNSNTILDDKNIASKNFRDTLSKYFNQVVYENEMKWNYWNSVSQDKRGVQAKLANEWFREHEMTIRGHVMVWQAWRHLNSLSEVKDDTAALRARIFDFIGNQATVLKGELNEWDVINEPCANNELIKILGKDEMIRWFNVARKAAPGVKLYLNDFTMFHGKGAGSTSQKFYDYVKYLKDNGAPIDAIGEQGHVGNTPPDINHVLERLDFFSTLNLPIQITEFDINSNDDDFKSRYMADFMTAIYSHPSTVGFVQWGFWAGRHWFPDAALWNKDWTITPQGKVFTNLVSKVWWTDTNVITDKNGVAKTRGFCGDYEISVSSADKSTKQKFVLNNKGGEITITL